MKQYLDLMQELLDSGNPKGDRTGTGTLSKFGHQMRFDLNEGFPLVTTKKIHLKSVIHELLWFLKGDTNIKYLNDNGVTIWDEWATPNGWIGPMYGCQWRSYEGLANGGLAIIFTDQIQEAIDTIKSNPNSRRICVTAWNPAVLPDESISPQDNVLAGRMALAPCHCFFQFYVHEGKLSCQLYQRSCDTFLGVPFNISSYALLTHMIAQQCDLGVGEFIWTGGDVHLYNNHLDQVRLQLTRQPKALPQLIIRRRPDSISEYVYEDFELIGYDPHPAIKAEVSV